MTAGWLIAMATDRVRAPLYTPNIAHYAVSSYSSVRVCVDPALDNITTNTYALLTRHDTFTDTNRFIIIELSQSENF